MARIISLILLIFLLGSCYHTAPDPAFNMTLVIPADSMVSLLTDIHLADGVINTIKVRDKSTGYLSNKYFEVVMDKHKIGRDTFEESLRYYAYHAEELDKIYEKVIVNLSKIESMAPAK